VSDERLSTGIGGLDRAIDGGVPPGSLIALTAGADSPGERLCYAAAAAHPARYFSTLRPGEVVDEAMDAATGGIGDGFDFRDEEDTPTRVLDVRDIDLLSAPGERFDDLGAGETVIVDPVNPLERGDRDAYRAFLDSLADSLRAAGGIGVLHAQQTPETPTSRGLTLSRADVTLELQRTIEDRVAWTLLVTKVRHGSLPTEILSMAFDDGVRVDETRELR
jgi:hypothetical protein